MWPVSSQDRVDETTQPGRDGSQPGPITAHRRDLHGNPALQLEVDDLRRGVEQMGALAQILRAWTGKTVEPNRLLQLFVRLQALCYFSARARCAAEKRAA